MCTHILWNIGLGASENLDSQLEHKAGVFGVEANSACWGVFRRLLMILFLVGRWDVTSLRVWVWFNHTEEMSCLCPGHLGWGWRGSLVPSCSAWPGLWPVCLPTFPFQPVPQPVVREQRRCRPGCPGGGCAQWAGSPVLSRLLRPLCPPRPPGLGILLVGVPTVRGGRHGHRRCRQPVRRLGPGPPPGLVDRRVAPVHVSWSLCLKGGRDCSVWAAVSWGAGRGSGLLTALQRKEEEGSCSVMYQGSHCQRCASSSVVAMRPGSFLCCGWMQVWKQGGGLPRQDPQWQWPASIQKPRFSYIQPRDASGASGFVSSPVILWGDKKHASSSPPRCFPVASRSLWDPCGWAPSRSPAETELSHSWGTADGHWNNSVQLWC